MELTNRILQLELARQKKESEAVQWQQKVSGVSWSCLETSNFLPLLCLGVTIPFPLVPVMGKSKDILFAQRGRGSCLQGVLSTLHNVSVAANVHLTCVK